MLTETSAIGDPPAWSWSLGVDAHPACGLDAAAMIEEGWAYLRQIFVVCFSGAQRISAAEMRALCGTTAALCFSERSGQLDALERLVKAQLRETMRRSAAGIDRHLPGPPLRAVVLARWTQLRAWSVLWERVFARFIALDAPAEFASAITARLQPSGLARALLAGGSDGGDEGGGGVGGGGEAGGSNVCRSLVFEEVVTAAGGRPLTLTLALTLALTLTRILTPTLTPTPTPTPTPTLTQTLTLTLTLARWLPRREAPKPRPPHCWAASSTAG